MQSTTSLSVIQVTYGENYVNKGIFVLANLARKIMGLKTTWGHFRAQGDTFLSVSEKVYLGMLSSL